MMYFAKYSDEAGINFSLDMIHNVPDSSKDYFADYCNYMTSDLVVGVELV